MRIFSSLTGDGVLVCARTVCLRAHFLLKTIGIWVENVNFFVATTVTPMIYIVFALFSVCTHAASVRPPFSIRCLFRWLRDCYCWPGLGWLYSRLGPERWLFYVVIFLRQQLNAIFRRRVCPLPLTAQDARIMKRSREWSGSPVARTLFSPLRFLFVFAVSVRHIRRFVGTNSMCDAQL